MKSSILVFIFILLMSGYVNAENKSFNINLKDLSKRIDRIDLGAYPPATQKNMREQIITAVTGLQKIGDSGEKLPSDASDWECVYDVNSELMWEVKKDDSTERRSAWGAKYSNDSNLPRGAPLPRVGKCDVYDEPSDCQRPENSEMCQKSDSCGYCEDEQPRNLSRSCQDDEARWPNNPLCKYNQLYYTDLCRTEAYVDYINDLRLCGYSDWRMPSIEEVRSISSHSGQSDRFSNSNYFPHGSKYHTLWSGEAASNGRAWLLYPGNYNLQELNRSDPNPVRLVRGQMVAE